MAQARTTGFSRAGRIRFAKLPNGRLRAAGTAVFFGTRKIAEANSPEIAARIAEALALTLGVVFDNRRADAEMHGELSRVLRRGNWLASVASGLLDDDRPRGGERLALRKALSVWWDGVAVREKHRDEDKPSEDERKEAA